MKATGYGWTSLGVLLCLLAVFACEKRAQDAPEPTGDPGRVVLARVGDEVVTVEDLGFIPVREKPSSKLEMLVMRKLAAAEARRRGLAEEPQTRAKLAGYRHSALMWEEGLLRNALFNSIRLGFTFSEEELRAHFEKTKDRYIEPQWTLRVQKLASEAEARAADAELGATGRLDPAKSEALGPAPAGQLPPDLRPSLPLFEQPGDRQVLDLAGAWSLVELEAYLPAAPPPFEAARERVDQDLRAVRAELVLSEELARLRAEQVVIDEAALAIQDAERDERAGAAATLRAGQRAERAAARAARRAAKQPAEAAPAEAAPAEKPPAEAP